MAPKKDAGKGGPALRDECVAYAWECLWTNLDQHLKDKFIFPQIVSHAVARTVAGVIFFFFFPPKEPVLPPIDAWARGVVPVKRPQPPLPVINAPVASSEVATSTHSGKSPKSPISPTPRAVPSRRTTFTLVPSSPTDSLSKASEIYDRKGSPVRRFSDGYVLPPELIHKFKPPDDAASTEGSVASGASSLRKERKSISRKSVLHLDSSSDSPSRRRASKFAEAAKAQIQQAA